MFFRHDSLAAQIKERGKLRVNSRALNKPTKNQQLSRSLIWPTLLLQLTHAYVSNRPHSKKRPGPQAGLGNGCSGAKLSQSPFYSCLHESNGIVPTERDKGQIEGKAALAYWLVQLARPQPQTTWVQQSHFQGVVLLRPEVQGIVFLLKSSSCRFAPSSYLPSQLTLLILDNIICRHIGD